MAEGYINKPISNGTRLLSWNNYSGEVTLNGSLQINVLCHAMLGVDGRYQVFFKIMGFSNNDYIDVSDNLNTVRITFLSPTKIKISSTNGDTPAFYLRSLDIYRDIPLKV